VIVVAGQEDEPPALKPLTHQAEEIFRRGERIARGGEQKIEQVAENDHLVDIEVGRQQVKVRALGQDVLAGPCAEMGVRDHQRPHELIQPD
jgi:hypothetical protein